MLNYLADYHMHTTRCGHAVGSMEAYVEHALRMGLREIGFSDHIPMYWLPEERRDRGIAMPMAELEAYVTDVLRLRERYPEIPIRLGLEADFIPGQEEALQRVLAPYPWDYVIGSVHFIGDWDFDNPAKVNRFAEWDIDDLYGKFFTLEMMAAESGLFDILAHIDLVKKFGHRASRDLGPVYNAVADVIARAGVAIELSTAGLRKPVREYYPAPDLLRACQERDVPLVISSDAHAPTEVGWGFADAARHAVEVGWRQVAFFEGRRRHLGPLGE
jgi:histidinol-phosphatase (PHP family)